MPRSRIDDAIVFAGEAHKTHKFVKAPTCRTSRTRFSVAMLLQQAGGEEVVVIAGLLHDKVEDTVKTLGDLKGRYSRTCQRSLPAEHGTALEGTKETHHSVSS